MSELCNVGADSDYKTKVKKMLVSKKSSSISVSVFAAAIFAVTYWSVIVIMGGVGWDYGVHAQSAVVILEKGIAELLQHNPYPIWQVLVAEAVNFFGIPLQHAAALVTGLCNVFCYIFTYRYLQINPEQSNWIAPLAFAAMLIGPLWLPWLSESLLFWTPNTWHNPTNLIVRPFAICIFSLIINMICKQESKEPITAKNYWLLAALMLLSNLAKPSFTQIIIPGLGMYVVLMLLRSRGKDFIFAFKMALCFVPCVAVTLVQFFASFYVASYGSEGVEIAWLVHLHESLGHVRYYAFLNLFPIMVFAVALLRRKMTYSRDIILVCCVWFSSFLEAGILIEKGSRRSDGNFTWGLILAAFLVYLVAIKVLAHETQQADFSDFKQKIPVLAGWTMFTLQMAIGMRVLFFFVHPLSLT